MSIELVAQRINVLRGKAASDIGKLSAEKDYLEDKLKTCEDELLKIKGAMIVLGECEGYINELIDV